LPGERSSSKLPWVVAEFISYRTELPAFLLAVSLESFSGYRGCSKFFIMWSLSIAHLTPWQLTYSEIALEATVLGCGIIVVSEVAAFMMNLLQIMCDHWVHSHVPVGLVFRCYLDRKNDGKLTAFRNKNLLYKRKLKSSEEVTRM